MIEKITEHFSGLAKQCLSIEKGPIAVEELIGSSVYFWLYELAKLYKGVIFFATENNETAQNAYACFWTVANILETKGLSSKLDSNQQNFTDITIKALYYPDIELTNLFEVSAHYNDLKELQSKVQQELMSLDSAVVFLPYRSLFRRTHGRNAVENSFIRLKAVKSQNPVDGNAISRISIDELCERLVSFGYKNESIVIAKGEFARRGGIVDIYPYGSYFPVRLDFFADEIEELKSFDPATQRSVQTVEEILILPKSPLNKLGGKDWIVEGVNDLMKDYEREMKLAVPDSALSVLKSTVNEDLLSIQEELDNLRLDFYLEAVGIRNETIVDFARKPAVIFYEPLLIENETVSFKRFWEARFHEWRQNALTFTDFSDYYLLPDKAVTEWIYQKRSEIELEWTKKHYPSFLVFPLKAPDDIKPPKLQAHCNHLSLTSYSISNVAKTIKDEEGNHILVTQFAQRIKDIVSESGATIEVSHGSLPKGFSLCQNREKITLVTDYEIFGELTETVGREPKIWRKGGLKTAEQLRPGDYVVHIDYGIGRFVGLTEKMTKDVKRVYVEIAYADNEKLFVPVDQMERLKLYRSSGTPKLSSLSRSTWKRTINKVRKDVFKFALKLFKLYRQRKTEAGYRFESGGRWMEEFIQGFPYELTPDQKEGWEAVERDMESSKVMDRLICGEVGYGKTEIALRAAFKANISGKQVLMLCPTTILAEQHYSTFVRRYKPFPFRVELLSRFQSGNTQKEIIRAIAENKVDVVIATHRALSKDIILPRLGLLIIDEEQRFGVKQKEELKLRYPNIDVLTLTATPIPRTLRMSLIGLLDISLIETPPPERKPVKTYVGEWNEHLIKDAIIKETNRGGQVYYLHNRVEDIGRVAQWLKELVPGLKVGIAHGKLPDKILEEMMIAFNLGAFDILLATTIIENGLDIPRVNTLIVDSAEHLGLAQMHQIRGRVGRSAVRAYAYFFHSPQRALTQEARERLRAIYSCAYLGAGYEIAQQDMLIRGAGTILGTEQSGAIEQIGMDYYFDLLQNAVESLKKFPEEFIDTGKIPWREEDMTVQVDLPLACFIPEDYIGSTPLRMHFYLKIASSKDEEELKLVREELVDRFGRVPVEAENLFYIARLKYLALKAEINQIAYIPAQQKLTLSFFNHSSSEIEQDLDESLIRYNEDAINHQHRKKRNIPTYSSKSETINLRKPSQTPQLLKHKPWLRKLEILDSRVVEVMDGRVSLLVPYSKSQQLRFKEDVLSTVKRIIDLSQGN